MNIVMLSNTFTPHVGGVARSVEGFSKGYRQRGHRVLVVAPEFQGRSQDEADVVRIPAIQKFNGSDFSVVLPVSGLLSKALDVFQPDLVHAHHPYLLGMTALRLARFRALPLVFTHHTLYEQYTHYVPGNSKTLQRFVIELATHYANLCDQVFAPSESILCLLKRRGVKTPVSVVPTGVDTARFAHGSGPGFRAAIGIPATAFVVGHVGRLAPEKNLEFLAQAVASFLEFESRAHFLLVGQGPSAHAMRALFERSGLSDRLHSVGVLDYPLLTSAYRAMDVFAFASKSETQGMVLTEAMTVGVPVIALDAPGAREVVIDRRNGLLLSSETIEAFVAALRWIARLAPEGMATLRRETEKTASEWSIERTVDRALTLYQALLKTPPAARDDGYRLWEETRRLIGAEWDILTSMADAVSTAIREANQDGPQML